MEYCPICNHLTFIKLDSSVPKYHIFQCEKCGTGFTFPKPDIAELESQYKQEYYGNDNKKFVQSLEKTVYWYSWERAKWIHRKVKKEGEILDIGCGRGLLLEYLIRLGHSCTGIERSSVSASRASKIDQLKLYVQPLEQCNFQTCNFRAVIIWHVLEHLDNPVVSIKEIYRILEPNGYLFLEVPNFDSWQSRISKKNWFHIDIERHLYHFSPAGLKKIMEESGFKIEFLRTFSFEQCPYGALQSLLNFFFKEKELLYKILKKEIKIPWFKKIFHLSVAGILFLPCFVFSVVEAIFGYGGVIRVIAKKIS